MNRRTALLFLSLPALWLGAFVPRCAAAEPRAPALAVSLEPAQDAYWAGQRVACTLALDLGGAELGDGGRLSVDGLPATGAGLDVGSFERVASADPTVLRWSAPLTLHAAGEVSFAPTLSGTLRRLTSRSGLFRQYTLAPFSATAPRTSLSVRPLPAEGRPADFCGAVGPLSLEAALSPAACAPGDLLTLRWTLRGAGAELAHAIPSYAPGPGFRVYPARVEAREDGRLEVSQVVIPLSTNVVSAAAFSVAFFDPRAAGYRTLSAGPFALAVAERPPEEADGTGPADARPPDESAGGTSGAPEAEGGAAAPPAVVDGTLRLARPLPGRLAPSATALKLFDVPSATPLRVRETRGAWLRVLLPDGSSAWIRPGADAAP